MIGQIEIGSLALDYESRMKVRGLVLDTFENIIVFHRGVTPVKSRATPIDLVLIAKGGAPRMLRIDRTTGEWIAQEDATN